MTKWIAASAQFKWPSCTVLKYCKVCWLRKWVSVYGFRLSRRRQKQHRLAVSSTHSENELSKFEASVNFMLYCNPLNDVKGFRSFVGLTSLLAEADDLHRRKGWAWFSCGV